MQIPPPFAGKHSIPSSQCGKDKAVGDADVQKQQQVDDFFPPSYSVFKTQIFCQLEHAHTQDDITAHPTSLMQVPGLQTRKTTGI